MLTKLKVPVSEKQFLCYTPVSGPLTDSTFKYLLSVTSFPPWKKICLLAVFVPLLSIVQMIIRMIFLKHKSNGISPLSSPQQFPVFYRTKPKLLSRQTRLFIVGQVAPLQPHLLLSLPHSVIATLVQCTFPCFCAWAPVAPSVRCPLSFIKAKSPTHSSSLIEKRTTQAPHSLRKN